LETDNGPGNRKATNYQITQISGNVKDFPSESADHYPFLLYGTPLTGRTV
jgi:hypothetical protein